MAPGNGEVGSKPQVSSIGMALAGKTASVGIPMPREAEPAAPSGWAATAGGGKQKPGGRRAELPTPPNSISPNLPPHTFKDRGVDPPTPPAQAGADSDIDLQDAVEHAAAQDQAHRSLVEGRKSEDNPEAVTPALLAAHHLPDILLTHGPLAIRHIMGFLMTAVPGFSAIPPAKARRIVVGALEGKGGNNGESSSMTPEGDGIGGVNNDVIFEKVGWGRWDARRKGDGPRHPRRQDSPTAVRHHGSNAAAHEPKLSTSPYPTATRTLNIPVRSRKRSAGGHHSSSFAHSHNSHKSRNTPLDETDADRMSLEPEEGASRRHGFQTFNVKKENVYFDLDGDEDMTDEEDWASQGAAALRAGSFPKRTLHKVPPSQRIDYNQLSRREHEMRRIKSGHLKGGSPGLPKSAPGFQSRMRGVRGEPAVSKDKMVEKWMEDVGEEENEAIKALLQLGTS